MIQTTAQAEYNKKQLVNKQFITSRNLLELSIRETTPKTDE